MNNHKRHIPKRNQGALIYPIIGISLITFVFILSSSYQKSWTYEWNGIHQQIKDSVKMAECKGLSGGLVGHDARRPSQFDRRQWIMNNASNAELLKLTEYPDGTIKTIGYEGLLRKSDYSNKTELVIKSITDTAFQINYQLGCEGTKMKIGKYLINHVLYLDNKNPHPKDFKNDIVFTSEEKNIIIFEYNKLSSL
jgi:hypothetical protein